MQNLILVITLILLLVCCKNRSQNETVPDTTNYGKTDIEVKRSISPLISDLQGVWAEREDENALFFIDKDSLTYVENPSQSFFIELKNDTLVIWTDLKVNCKILKLTKDSLWYIDEFSSETTKLYRRE